MKTNKTKKVIVFVLEGRNDQIVIETILHTNKYKKILDYYVPMFKIMGHDITSDYAYNAKNVISKLNDEILTFIRKTPGIGMNDIAEIVQIIDLDGAYISDVDIVESDVAHPIYHDNKIEADNINAIIDRNGRKRSVVKRLVEQDNINGIYYTLYYAACNMDHIAFDKRNLQKMEKHILNQGLLWDEGTMLIENVFSNPSIATSSEYFDSWDYITIRNNSLKRKTNINLFFEKKISELNY